MAKATATWLTVIAALDVRPWTDAEMVVLPFPVDVTVSVADETVTVLSSTVRSPEHIEVELLASEGREAVEIIVTESGGFRASVEVAVEP